MVSRTRSSAEAEYISMTQGIYEVQWIDKWLQKLNIHISTLIKLYCDNKTAIAHNMVLHDRTKHMEVDKHLIKEKIEKGHITIPYIPTKDQTVNILTKGLSKKHFDYIIGKLSMEDFFKPL